jgi:hypothetical protein
MNQNAVRCAAVGTHEGYKPRAASEWSDLRHARHWAAASLAGPLRRTFIVLPLELGPFSRSDPRRV